MSKGVSNQYLNKLINFMKNPFKFIQEVSAVNKDCTWGFITNCHYRISKQLRETLEPLNIRHIHLSMDAISEKTYGEIRLKGDFKRVRETVFEFVKMRNERAKSGRGFTLFASMCVQIGNWHELPAFLNFCDENSLQPIIQELIGRSHLSLHDMPQECKDELYNLYKNHIPQHYKGHIASILNNLGYVD